LHSASGRGRGEGRGFRPSYLSSCIVRIAGLASRPCQTPTNLTAADPKDLADALSFGLRYSGRKRTQDAAEIMGGDRG